MLELMTGVGQGLADRLHGPLAFRLLIQPLMATLLAVRAGVKDGHRCRPAYLWAVLTDPAHRRELLHGGWKDISRVFLLAIAMDVVFQLIVFHTVHPLGTLLVAVVLAALPYVIVRGPVSRLARKDRPPSAPRGAGVGSPAGT
jgi:hypothetical protein